MTTGARIQRAAVKLFATKGFHGTGIRDLAKAARLSSASLYHHMGTKEELLAGIMRDALGRLATAAERAVDGVDDPRERLGRLVALHVMTHAMRPNETRVVDNELAALSPGARRSVIRLRDGYEALWSEAIGRGVAARAFLADDLALTRLALLEMCNGVARWYSPRGTVPVEQLAEHYARLAMRLLGCPPPARGPDLARCRAVVTEVWRGAV